MHLYRLVSVVGFGGMLAVASFIQVTPKTTTPVRSTMKLGALIPAAVPGWTVRDVNLGESDASTTAVIKMLNLDSYIYREFRRADISLYVYIGQWAAGRMPVQLVSSHTPDRCWTESGWICVGMAHDVPLATERVATKNGESRIFQDPSGRYVYVHYWHLVNGQQYIYERRFNNVPSPWRWWSEASRQILSSPPEQQFVRISSTVAFDTQEIQTVLNLVVSKLDILSLSNTKTREF